MTLYHIVFQFKDPSKVPTRKKLRLTPLLIKNLGAVTSAFKKVQSRGGEAELELTEAVMNYTDSLLASGTIKGAYQLFDRYDSLSADITLVYIADWKYEEANRFVSQFRETILNVARAYFAHGGLRITDKELSKVMSIFSSLEVHKALPLKRALEANLAAAKRRLAVEAPVQKAPHVRDVN